MDGPSEVHQDVIARRVLRAYSPAPGDWPTQFLPDLVAAAQRRYGIDREPTEAVAAVDVHG
jgi:acyl-CoA dehydrogenase